MRGASLSSRPSNVDTFFSAHVFNRNILCAVSLRIVDMLALLHFRALKDVTAQLEFLEAMEFQEATERMVVPDSKDLWWVNCAYLHIYFFYQLLSSFSINGLHICYTVQYNVQCIVQYIKTKTNGFFSVSLSALVTETLSLYISPSLYSVFPSSFLSLLFAHIFFFLESKLSSSSSSYSSSSIIAYNGTILAY